MKGYPYSIRISGIKAKLLFCPASLAAGLLMLFLACPSTIVECEKTPEERVNCRIYTTILGWRSSARLIRGVEQAQVDGHIYKSKHRGHTRSTTVFRVVFATTNGPVPLSNSYSSIAGNNPYASMIEEINRFISEPGKRRSVIALNPPSWLWLGPAMFIGAGMVIGLMPSNKLNQRSDGGVFQRPRAWSPTAESLRIQPPPPMTGISDKICSICGLDCAHEPRYQDWEGRYFHQTCYVKSRSVS